MRILVIGAGVIGSVYSARLAAAGHDVAVLARGGRRAQLARDGVRLRSPEAELTARPGLVPEGGPLPEADLILVTVRSTQLDAVLGLVAASGCPAVAFLQHLGAGVQDVQEVVGRERTILAFPGVGGLVRDDGTVEYVEVAAQPTTIDATAPRGGTLRDAVASTGMRTASERDMPGWFATHEVFVACLGAGVLACGGAKELAADRRGLRTVVQAVHEGFAALAAQGISVTPTALRVLFSRMPRWFAAAYWRRSLAGPVGTVAIAPHTRASREDEFAAVCADVLAHVGGQARVETLVSLLAPCLRPAGTTATPSGPGPA